MPKTKKQVNTIEFESALWPQYPWVAGLDEAGRGCWAGPVVAAAVIFKPGTDFPEINDSKKITPKKREEIFDLIIREAYSYGIQAISPEVVDEINILQASLLAMKQAVSQLKVKPDYLLIDGNQGLNLDIPQKPIIKGDSLSMSIAAASILAKVTRDRYMIEIDAQYPGYDFKGHKGYGTKKHVEALKKHGVTNIHRKSYRPIREMLG